MMVKYLTFFHYDFKNDFDDVRCLLDPPQYVVRDTDIAIVPKSGFSDTEIQRKILILARKGILFSDFGVRKFCSDITIAGFLYNCFVEKINTNIEYYKTYDCINDMILILEEISYALRAGFGIFNDLYREEMILKKQCSEISSHGSRYAAPFIYESFSKKISSLLYSYQSNIDERLKQVVNSKEFICHIYNSSLIYTLYPAFDFNPSLRELADYYNKIVDDDINKVHHNSETLFINFDGNYNILDPSNYHVEDFVLLLSKWLGKNISSLRYNLFISICNALDKFYEQASNFCKGSDNFDILFPLFNYLMKKLNIVIIETFKRKSLVLYYADLKHQLVLNKSIQEITIKICNCFSNQIQSKYFSVNEYIDAIHVLKQYFFNVDSLLGICQKSQRYEFENLSRILLEINYDWMNTLASKNFIPEDTECSINQGAEKFDVVSKKYGNQQGRGILQVVKLPRRRSYICDFIEEKLFIKNTTADFSNNARGLIHPFKHLFKKQDDLECNIDTTTTYNIKSLRICLFYDKFYIYIVVRNEIVLKIFHSMVFPSVDTAVMTLVSEVFKLKSIQKR